MEENICPVCYENLTDGKTIIYGSCRHSFCDACTNNIIFEHSCLWIKCPLDRTFSENLDIISNEGIESTTVLNYLNHFILENQDNLLKEVYKTWCKNIQVTIDSLKFFQHSNNVFNRVINQSYVKFIKGHDYQEVDLDTYSRHVRNEFARYQITVEMNPLHFCSKFEILKEFLIFTKKIYFRSFMKIEHLEIITNFLMTFDSFKNVIGIYDPCIIREEFINEVNIALTKVLMLMEKLFELIRYFIISTTNIGKSEFQSINRNLTENEINNCLLCLNIVSSEIYAFFPACCHKICLTCSKRYMITGGICPFDGGIDADLHIHLANQMSTMTATELITREYPKINYEYFKESAIYIRHRLLESKTMLWHFFEFFQSLFDIEKTKDSNFYNDWKSKNAMICQYISIFKFSRILEIEYDSFPVCYGIAGNRSSNDEYVASANLLKNCNDIRFQALNSIQLCDKIITKKIDLICAEKMFEKNFFDVMNVYCSNSKMNFEEFDILDFQDSTKYPCNLSESYSTVKNEIYGIYEKISKITQN